MSAKITTWQPGSDSDIVSAFLQRPAFDAKAEEVARDILGQIRRDGDNAVLLAARRFDGADMSAAQMRVPAAEIAAAGGQVDEAFRDAVAEADRRISAFASAGMRHDWRIPTANGGSLGEQFTPLDRVGVYVPGGTAPLASTALMTASLARCAGVPEIVACTPCGPDLSVNPFLLYALKQAGATEIYRVGGIQAIGLMAFGTPTVPKVQKIVGPGNAYVTAAKRQVYGYVALDLVAGPSEIAILADDSASPAFVAADLLSQAEHGTGPEKALLATPSDSLARAVQAELDRQTTALSRREAIERIIEAGVLLVVVDSLADGMELCNRFAAEHLELMVEDAGDWVQRVRRAGAIFVGPWSPEPTGDFVAGPSHVLPTGGAAALFSGLTVDDFRKRSSIVAYTREDLQDALPVIAAFGRVEGLDAHSRSASIRFESDAS